MPAKKPSPLPVTFIGLSTRCHEELCPDVTVGSGGLRRRGYSVWDDAQKTIDEWRQRIPVDEVMELTVTVEWADGDFFVCEMHVPHASEPCLSEESILAIHFRRYLEYDAGLRDYWAPSRASMRRFFARGLLRPGVTAEEMERDLDMRDAERNANAIEMLATREVPKVPASHRDSDAELAVLLYRLAGRDVQAWDMDAYSWDDALGEVDRLADEALRPMTARDRTRLLSSLLQHEEQRVRLGGVKLSARLANLSPGPKPRKRARVRGG